MIGGEQEGLQHGVARGEVNGEINGLGKPSCDGNELEEAHVELSGWGTGRDARGADAVR